MPPGAASVWRRPDNEATIGAVSANMPVVTIDRRIN
jgi:hypothetical protein